MYGEIKDGKIVRIGWVYSQLLPDWVTPNNFLSVEVSDTEEGLLFKLITEDGQVFETEIRR